MTVRPNISFHANYFRETEGFFDSANQINESDFGNITRGVK